MSVGASARPVQFEYELETFTVRFAEIELQLTAARNFEAKYGSHDLPFGSALWPAALALSATSAPTLSAALALPVAPEERADSSVEACAITFAPSGEVT